MRKNTTAGKSEPAQPLLPEVNLAKLLVVQPTWCGCDCGGCPPWLHCSGSCASRCERLGVPPLCNTGVHATRKHGVSDGLKVVRNRLKSGLDHE